MVRPATPPGAAGPPTLVNRSLERKHPAQCAALAFASADRTASLTPPPLPAVNSL